MIRAANDDDLPGILEIYNHAVLHTTAIWKETESDLEFHRQWLQERLNNNFPVLVADEDGTLAGYASFSHFRNNPGYWPTVEHSVHVHHLYRRRGIGRMLMERLFNEARRREKRVVIGGIDALSEPSLFLHRSLGFLEVGRLSKIGRKFGQELDLVFMQKLL